ncbi:hypothetical protein MNBD_CHLOROFLEXI01-5072 [hydrothermal vent metagenome]|uniref:PIN domain-containing protein n=1 Tax=hydrothermal vent metagenome TaxID=652676 RepID=A0A3B0UZN7_9ZZZZ
MRVYFDSAPLIYLVERVSPYVEQLSQQLSSEDIIQVCSDLTRLECRVKPMRDGETALLAAFDSYFAEIITETVSLTRTVMDRATELRANFGFKTPDAIHLAYAIVAKCDLFLTNDNQLKKQNEIAVELIGVSK